MIYNCCYVKSEAALPGIELNRLSVIPFEKLFFESIFGFEVWHPPQAV